MAARKPKVIVTRKLPQPVEARMSALFEAVHNNDDHAFTLDELIAAAGDADVLVSTITDRIDTRVIEAAGSDLKLIANFGAGVDHIDVNAATARGLTVTNTPGVLTEDTADMTIALMLAAARRLVEGSNLAQSGGFTGWTPTSMMGRRMRGARLGIIGMGRIGQAVARRARAFGLEVHYHNRKRVGTRIEATCCRAAACTCCKATRS